EHFDVSTLLPAIKAPTLVVHNQNSPWIRIQSGRRLASEITDSRFVPVDDLTYAQLPALVDEFLREGQSQAATAGLPSGTAVILEDNNVYGGAVNVASRISGLSEPGEVLVSDTVRSLARTSTGVRFEDRGEQALKGVGEPMRVWAVREAE